jgi:hypothetical protein
VHQVVHHQHIKGFHSAVRRTAEGNAADGMANDGFVVFDTTEPPTSVLATI